MKRLAATSRARVKGGEELAVFMVASRNGPSGTAGLDILGVMLAAVRFCWNATRGARLRPWRSPYIKWRIETYSGMHAETLTARDVLLFTWRERRQLLRFLRWTNEMDAVRGALRKADARGAGMRSRRTKWTGVLLTALVSGCLMQGMPAVAQAATQAVPGTQNQAGTPANSPTQDPQAAPPSQASSQEASGKEQGQASGLPSGQTAGQTGGAAQGGGAGGANATPTFRVNSTVVLVPTLVEQKDGKVIYGLGANAFSLTDNGVPQKLHVEDDLDTTPVSLVVCIEKGRSSDLQFAKFERLAPLLNLFLGTGNGEVSVVEFDSQLEYRGDWTHDTDEVQQDMDQLVPGDGGAALLDAAGYSIGLLEQRPADRRRILLLLSESRDHGSKRVTSKQLVEQIGASNTLVLSLTWSPAKAEFLHNLENPGTGGIDVIQLAILAVNAMKANAAKSLAVMSGGEAMSFGSESSFEERVSDMASHARNRYMLSFHPTELTPGLHLLQVQLQANVPGKVVARTDYWAGTDDSTP